MNPPELPDNLIPTSPLSPGTAPQRKFATMKLNVPDGVDLMSDTDLRAALQAQETRESMAPSNRREKAILGATQLNWRGHPILWTCGRLTLFQALGETTGAESIPGFNPNRPFMDAVIFVFLATHPETVWEQSRYVKFEGKDLTLPPLVADFANFYSVIRHWGDTYIGPRIPMSSGSFPACKTNVSPSTTPPKPSPSPKTETHSPRRMTKILRLAHPRISAHRPSESGGPRLVPRLHPLASPPRRRPRPLPRRHDRRRQQNPMARTSRRPRIRRHRHPNRPKTPFPKIIIVAWASRP